MESSPPPTTTEAEKDEVINDSKLDPESYPQSAQKGEAESYPRSVENHGGDVVLHQFLAHRAEVVESVAQLLKDRGFFNTTQITKRYPLELIVEAIAAVDKMIDEGIEVKNPVGLIKWRVERGYEDAQKAAKANPPGGKRLLTDREREILRYLAQGCRYHEMEKVHRIPRRTAEDIVRRAMGKLEVRTPTAAVVKAIMGGEIFLDEIGVFEVEDQ